MHVLSLYMPCHVYNALMECIFDATLKYTSHGIAAELKQQHQAKQSIHPVSQPNSHPTATANNKPNICSQMPIGMKCLHFYPCFHSGFETVFIYVVVQVIVDHE